MLKGVWVYEMVSGVGDLGFRLGLWIGGLALMIHGHLLIYEP